ncbi:545_t:CDS:2 [Scutellospora calospora]|uniref:545_t:CDS:1 n=1 Tax=Scutellospora calospora TaxID=85575 RepID=A0ACA9K4T5_9GLOM|nr:545_t:CDS:2 [Scutellospora calospora]
MAIEENNEKDITNNESAETASYDDYNDKLMVKKVVRKIDIYILRWAICSMCQAAVTSALTLGITRFFLGVAEAGFSPAVIDYICLFYSRKEMTMRYGIFMALSIISGAFSGLIAYGIVLIKGLKIKSFQLIFILEGIPTIILAIIVALFFTKGPADARFLTPKERLFVVERLRPDGGVDEENHTVIKSQAKSAFFDIRVYGYVFAAVVGSIPNSALSYFLPTLVSQLGFDTVQTQLMSVPPYLVATVVMLSFSWYADKYQSRALPILISDIISIIGATGMLTTSATDPSLYKLRYFFVTLISCGVYSAQPIIYSWITSNILGQYKRNITIAVGFTLANVGSVVGILLFQKTMAPAYTQGMILALSMMAVQFVIVVIMKFHLEHENRRRDLLILSNNNIQLSESELKDNKLIREKAMKIVEYEPKFDEVLCDNHPNWRYYP